jgi:hypothetical protein
MTTKLESYLDRQMTRVILNLPPRSLKSGAAKICFPAYGVQTQDEHTRSFTVAKAITLPTSTRRSKKRR